MSILIKGMEMPPSCRYCAFRHMSLTHNAVCTAANEEIDYMAERTRRLDNCPLIPVPPHGDLIEENKVLDIVFEWCPDDDGSVGKDGDLREMLDEIEALPTIIPATK